MVSGMCRDCIFQLCRSGLSPHGYKMAEVVPTIMFSHTDYSEAGEGAPSFQTSLK